MKNFKLLIKLFMYGSMISFSPLMGMNPIFPLLATNSFENSRHIAKPRAIDNSQSLFNSLPHEIISHIFNFTYQDSADKHKQFAALSLVDKKFNSQTHKSLPQELKQDYARAHSGSLQEAIFNKDIKFVESFIKRFDPEQFRSHRFIIKKSNDPEQKKIDALVTDFFNWQTIAIANNTLD